MFILDYKLKMLADHSCSNMRASIRTNSLHWEQAVGRLTSIIR